MGLTHADREWIERSAVAAGFDLAGVASVSEPACTAVAESAAADENDRRFAHWIDAGYAGEMEYLKRADASGNYLRGDLRRSMPWARSIIVCAINYNVQAPRSIDSADPRAGWIARYAWSGRQDSKASCEGSSAGSDYHDVLLPKLQIVEAELKRRFGANCETRCYVDTGPLVERGYAARAGVGWIGKNTCILNQEKGSWLLLGVIVTSLELAQEGWAIPAADRCGSCTRCIDACPTDALIQPGRQGARQMDASRCIAYLTIEKKGDIPEDLRALMGRQVFGCDICQEVCPWNRKATISQTSPLPPRRELINPALEWLAAMDGSAFNRVFRGSPLERTRRKRVLRNVAIAMGNSGVPAFLPQLDEWAAAEDATLADAAAWAAARLRSSAAPKAHDTSDDVLPLPGKMPLCR